MKKFRIFILVCVAALLFGSLAACGNDALDRPTGLQINNKVLTWNAVSNARGYVVEIVGVRTVTTDRTMYSFASVTLEEGVYTLRVKARGNGVDAEDSEWASIRYTQPYESGMVYSLNSEGTEYRIESVGRARGDIVIDDTYNGLPVTEIAAMAFANDMNVTKVTLGANIERVGERAFGGCAEMTEVVLNDRLKEIGDRAFQSCAKLSSVSIPDSVVSIGASAFAYCRVLADLDLGEGVETIGEEAFLYTDALEGIEFPASLATVGDSAFSHSGVKAVAFGACDAAFGLSVFESCPRLSSIDFGGLTVVQNGMFSACPSLVDVTVPDTVRAIGSLAFRSCANLASIDIGDGVSVLGSSAFTGTKLYTDFLATTENIFIVDRWVAGVRPAASADVPSVTQADFNKLADKDIVGFCYGALAGTSINTARIPDSVKYIGRQAFDRCLSLTAVQLGAQTEIVGYGAFYLCTALQRVVMNDVVKTIDGYAFCGCEMLKASETNIPASVTRVGTYAYYMSGIWNDQAFIKDDDGNITNDAENKTRTGIVYLSDWVVGCDVKATGGMGGEFALFGLSVKSGIKAISDYAFTYCRSLYIVNLPDSVKSIGEGAFYACDATETGLGNPVFTIELPDGITTIEEATFSGCALTSITIPSSVTTIKARAFQGSGLMSLTIPDTVTEVGSAAFSMCTRLMDVKIGSGIDKISDSMFQGCQALSEIVIPDTVTSIGDRAFFHCDGLMRVNFGKNVNEIGEYAFYMCGSLKSIKLPDAITSIEQYAFYKCVLLDEIVIPDGVTRIGYAAFYGCDKLANVVIPDSVTRIEGRAFMLCPELQAVHLGASITYIGNYAFYGCRNATFYCQAETKPLGWEPLWNSFYRPALFSCEYNLDGSLMSFTKNVGTVYNYNAVNGLFPPSREGYIFVGWATDGQATYPEYTMSNFTDAPDGTVLYAVWSPVLEA